MKLCKIQNSLNNKWLKVNGSKYHWTNNKQQASVIINDDKHEAKNFLESVLADKQVTPETLQVVVID